MHFQALEFNIINLQVQKPAQPQFNATKSMKFSEIIDLLKQGECFSRKEWNGKFITCQIPQTIPPHVVPNMTSLPQKAKDIIAKSGNKDAKGFLSYNNQVLQVVISDLHISYSTYYIPTWEDIFSDDWYKFE